LQTEHLNYLNANESYIQSKSNESKRHFVPIHDDGSNQNGPNSNTQQYAYVISTGSPEHVVDTDSQASALQYGIANLAPSSSQKMPTIMQGAPIANIMSQNNRSQLVLAAQQRPTSSQRRNEANGLVAISGQSLNKYIIDSGMAISGVDSSNHRNDVEKMLIGSGGQAIKIDTQGQGTLGVNLNDQSALDDE
jgi:hypothetical protein